MSRAAKHLAQGDAASLWPGRGPNPMVPLQWPSSWPYPVAQRARPMSFMGGESDEVGVWNKEGSEAEGTGWGLQSLEVRVSGSVLSRGTSGKPCTVDLGVAAPMA